MQVTVQVGSLWPHKRIRTSMPCLTLTYIDFFYLKTGWWKTPRKPTYFDYFNEKNVDKFYF